MRIHREGRASLLILGIPLFICLGLAITSGAVLWIALSIWFGGFFVFVLQFFRNPDRTIAHPDENAMFSPADGKVVAIEEVTDPEILTDKRIQVSIFMSPTDVHANRVPISGMIKYFKYHTGKYLVAWHPKSSTENERTTFVLSTKHGDILIRQIAGAVARRIMSYPKVGVSVQQGDELGFIKFGSRCDIFFPIHAHISVKIGDHVKGNIDIIARFDD
ncbi:MAG: phosphatidylserine decarboxylase family protein [Bacteroidetes bacterium]|nr:MAG: phosphatidylserine decarboxylase family protein [Bacteroidota bacterium]